MSEEPESELPYAYRRDRVLDERDATKTVCMQEETIKRYKEVYQILNKQYDKKVRKTDVSEAALRAGLEGRHIEDVLQEWGYWE